jgi:hypothetical membrane protein
MKVKPEFYLIGVAAVFFYTVHVILGGALWEGYSHYSQPVSDLTSTGAPHRFILSVFTNIYSILSIIFALLIVRITRFKGKILRAASLFFLLMHLLSFSYVFFPQDLPGSEETYTGVMHLVLTGFIVPVTIVTPLIFGIGFLKQGLKTMGYYSVITSILIFIFGGLSAYAFGESLDFFGIAERLNIGSLLLWMSVLAVRFYTNE